MKPHSLSPIRRFRATLLRAVTIMVVGTVVFTSVYCARKTSSSPAPPVSSEGEATQPGSQPPAAAKPQDPQEPATHQHKEVNIPTPVATLSEAPLDVSSHCSAMETKCLLLILYKDRLVAFDWENSKPVREVQFPSEAYGLKSRAPSGKILRIENSYVILTNSLAKPLQFDQALMIVSSDPVRQLFPLAEPGMNWFKFSDGRFYDFEMLEPQGIAVVDTSYHLSIAQGGRLLTSDKIVGAALALSGVHVYTSAPTLPDENDTILKFSFSFEPRSIRLDTSRAVDGEILDLALVDLNQDRDQEVLVTIRNVRGITIDVLENF